MRKAVLVTSVRPSSPIPPTTSVTHTGSPEKSCVVLGGAQKAHDAQLDHEVVDDLLRLRLGERAVAKVALEVDVQNVDKRPADIAAPFCCLMAARYPK